MKICVLVMVATLLSGCVSIKSQSKLPTELSGEYITLIEMFVVARESRPSAIALPDTEFWGTKSFQGASSGDDWIANPERFPDVIDFIPLGASLRFTHAVRESGFFLWFGFGSLQTIMAEIDGHPHAVNAHDLFLYSCDGERALNNKFIKKK